MRSSRERARRDLSKQMQVQDSSSDSDFFDLDGNYGPTTRRAWSDWCSNKGKSSASEDESTGKVSIVTGSNCGKYEREIIVVFL